MEHPGWMETFTRSPPVRQWRALDMASEQDKAQWRLDGHKAGLAGKPDSPPWFSSDEKASIWREGWAAGAMEKAGRDAAASDAPQKEIPAGPIGD